MKPTVAIEVITPEVAKEWLDKSNKNNRKINKNRVALMADHIKTDKFILSPDAIAFDTNGRMYNGQHRLTACVETGEPIECIVLRQAIKESFMITDIGMKKLGNHALETSGYSQAKLLSSVARLVALAEINGVKEAWSGHTRNVTPNEIVDVVSRYKKLVEICERAKELSGRECINCPASVLGYCLWMANESGQYHDMLDFLTRVANGAGLTVYSPELALQRRLNKFEKSQGRRINNEQCALVLKAFIAKQNKAKVEKLSWREDEGFPILEAA